MNLIFSALLLGVVEGITEFLPISSTGHLILFNKFIDFEGDFAKTFDVIIQLGAILSVIVYFWRRITPWAQPQDQAHAASVYQLWGKSIAGVLPALAIGFFAADFIEEKLFNPAVVGSALLAGGVILIALESRKKLPRFESIADLTYRTAILIGLIQCLAMIPGTSRSAATILGAMALGLSRAAAAEFSFFLAIPTMAAASSYSMLKLVRQGTNVSNLEWVALLVGFVTSFLVAWAVIALFMKFIRNHNFRPFGWYRILLALVVFGWVYWDIMY